MKNKDQMPWKVEGLHKGKKKEKGGTLSEYIVVWKIKDSLDKGEK